MQKTTQAIVLHAYGGVENMQLQEVPLAPPSKGEIQLQHKAIGLNFIDIYYRTGLYTAPLPHGLGFEAAGVVSAVGEGVNHIKEGDRVAYGFSPLGAYAYARNIPAKDVVKLPDGISFENAAALMLKGLTVQYLFRQTYCLKKGETTLLHAAAGGVGLIACQWAKALGVNLIGTVSSPEKAVLAKSMGAWETINYSTENVVDRVLELTHGEKLAVVYDGVGKDTFETSLDCLRPRGLLVSYGNASGSVTGVNLGILASKGSLYVTRPGLATHVDTPEKLQAAADEVFAHVLAGDINVHIAQRFPLHQIAQAHNELANRKTVGSTVCTIEE